MSSNRYPYVTFLTDYGLENKFIGVCHGVMARIAPDVRVLDVTHLVPRGDIRHASVVLRQAVPYLPERAVHLCVVDPGVGTSRRAVGITAGDSVLVGPDNGLLMWAADELGGAGSAYELTDLTYALKPMSTTFHGRDLFSPFAAHIARGLELSKVGPEVPVESLVRLPEPLLSVAENVISAEVLLTDRFGNLQTSIDEPALAAAGIARGATLEVTAGGVVHRMPFDETFANVPAGALLAHVDSAGVLAIAVNLGSAEDVLRIRAGDQFRLRVAG